MKNKSTMVILEAMLMQAIMDYGQACANKDYKKMDEVKRDLEHGILADYIELRGLSSYELMCKTERYMGR